MQPSTQYQVEEWHTFNDLAKRTLQYDPLEKEDLADAFMQIERLIFAGIDHLLVTTTFVEDNVCYLIAEIAVGSIKSRKVYKGKRVRKRISLLDDVEMGSENRRIFGIGFDLFKLSRMEREQAIPYVRRIIRTLRISTSNYENILSAFVREGEKYCETSDELAELTLTLLNLKHRYETTPSEDLDLQIQTLTPKVDALIDQLDLIGLNIGCVRPNFLYGTIRAVQTILKRIRWYQDKILRAYLRLVLKPAKARARNEMQALDLFQSGSLGLSRAISLYDPRQGTSFPTFANWWIRQKILGYDKHSGSLIKLPGSVIEKYQEIRRAERHFESDPDMRSSYTVEDVAKFCNTSVKSIDLVKKKVRGTRVIPLESMVYTNDDGYEADHAADRALLDETIEENEFLAAQHDFVEQVLNYVSKPQRNLVCLRYGILENVVNSINPRQRLREYFRQAYCKAVLQKSMVEATENQLWQLRIEELPLD